MITPRTKFYVTSHEGTSVMTFTEVTLAVKGGMRIDQCEITTDPEESKKLERKRKAKAHVQELMNRMTPVQAEMVVSIIHGNNDLMDIHEEYQ